MFLFFDTETTGLNRYRDNLVQLAWVVTDKKGKILSENEWIIKPSGFTIPYMSERVHGISTSHAKLHGIGLEKALEKFVSDAKTATFIVAHNISFDLAIVKAAFSKCGLDYSLSGLQQIDTMTMSTNWCQLPKLNGISGFKRPRLEELHYRLFGEGIENAHQALADTKATMRCFYALIDEGVIFIPDSVTKPDKIEKKINKYTKPIKKNITISDALTILSESETLSDRVFVAQHHLLSDQLLQKLITDSSIEVLLELAKRIQLNEASLDLLMSVHNIDEEAWLNLESRLAFKGIPITSNAKERERFLLKLEFNFKDLEDDGEDLLAFALAFLQNPLLSNDIKSVIFFSMGLQETFKHGEKQKIKGLIPGFENFSVDEHQKFLWERINYLQRFNDEFMFLDCLSISADPFLSKEMIIAYLNMIDSLVASDFVNVDDLSETIIPDILQLEVVDADVLAEIFRCLDKLNYNDKLLETDILSVLIGMCSKHPGINADLLFELLENEVIATEYFDFENPLITKEMIVRLVLNGKITDETLAKIPNDKKVPELVSLHEDVKFFSMIEWNLWGHSRSIKDKSLDIKTFYKSINGCDLSNPVSFKNSYIQTKYLPNLYNDEGDVYSKVATIHRTLMSGKIFGAELQSKAFKWADKYEVKPLGNQRT